MGLERIGNVFEDIGEFLRPIWDQGGRQDVRVRVVRTGAGSQQIVPRRTDQDFQRQMAALGVQILSDAILGSRVTSEGRAEFFLTSPISGRRLKFRSAQRRAEALDALERSRARQRSFASPAGAVLPTPARDLSTTAAFPVTASAQEPILAGSRSDPFGFIRPGFAPAFGAGSRATTSRFGAV